MANGAGDRFVRVAKRHPFAHQIIGEVGGRRKTFACRRAHPFRIGFDAGRYEVCHDGERVGKRVDRVEQRLLVFLVVLVVRERLRLHQHDQRREMAGDARRLAAHELGDVGILLLRHDRTAGRPRVVVK